MQVSVSIIIIIIIIRYSPYRWLLLLYHEIFKGYTKKQELRKMTISVMECIHSVSATVWPQT